MREVSVSRAQRSAVQCSAVSIPSLVTSGGMRSRFHLPLQQPLRNPASTIRFLSFSNT